MPFYVHMDRFLLIAIPILILGPILENKMKYVLKEFIDLNF